MKTLLLVLVGTSLLAALVVWLSFRAVETIREFAPQWLTPDGKLPPAPVRPRATRLVPKGRQAKETCNPAPGQKSEEVAQTRPPVFARGRPFMFGGSAPGKNWVAF